MKLKFKKLAYFCKEGLRGVFSHGLRSFASVTVIAACLIIMGSFAMVSLNVDSFIEDLEQESEILAFVDENLTNEEAQSLESVVRSVSNVRDVQFITREEALENYKSQYEDQSLFDDIDASVFRNRYVVYLNDITLMKITQQNLESINGIAQVSAYVEIAEGFITIRNVISVITLIIIAVLFVVSMFMMANTIKLAAFTRREEIGIMKIVGATNGFIRFPFIIEGLILGLLGALIGFFLEWLIYNFLATQVMASLAGNLIQIVPFGQFMTPMLIIYLAIGLLMGALGGALAIRNYLKV